MLSNDATRVSLRHEFSGSGTLRVNLTAKVSYSSSGHCRQMRQPSPPSLFLRMSYRKGMAGRALFY